jgi:crotonobetainyl-CoA:carnitine CoA-transferase CaiB-like acyl-CoA transferase
MRGPMEGVRVVEAGVWVAGPAVGAILADWGADVVKIEPPEGDPGRTFASMLGADLPLNPPFELDNRGKRSIVLDLGRPEAAEIAGQLVRGADVFVTNIRASALSRLGLDYASLSKLNPRLVYALVTGYGLEGPDKDRAAYDIAAFWARSGLAGLLTTPGQPPPFQRGGMGDHGVGATAAGAIGAALYARERTGKGQLVSASLLRHGIYTIGFDLNVAVRLGTRIGTPMRAAMTNPVINCYTDSEGRWFWLVGLEADRHWPGLARAVGHPEWVEDPRFATARDRARNAAELIGLLDTVFSTRTRAEWGEALDREDVWWAPVQTTEEVLSDPQVHASGALVEVPDGAGSATMVASPVDFLGTPSAPASMPPELGQHTDEILSELGHSRESIQSLRAGGVVA